MPVMWVALAQKHMKCRRLLQRLESPQSAAVI
jgi:hypothetical protein